MLILTMAKLVKNDGITLIPEVKYMWTALLFDRKVCRISPSLGKKLYLYTLKKVIGFRKAINDKYDEIQ